MKGELVVASASLAGQRHLANGQVNQDSLYYEVMPDGQGLIAAVSDGAGSASRAKDGSLLAARTAVKHTKRIIQKDSENPTLATRSGLLYARQAIEQYIQIFPSHSIEDYHCTLVLIAWIGDLISGIQIGDGAAIVGTSEGYKMLTVPRQGEYVNETFFITEPHYLQTVFQNEASNVDSVALFTDGLQKLAIDFQHKKANQAFMEQAMSSLSTSSQNIQPADPQSTDQDQLSDEQTDGQCEPTIPMNTLCPQNKPGSSHYDTALHDWLSNENVAGQIGDDVTLILATRRHDA